MVAPTSREEMLKRAARIRLLVTDVDGVLTDGGVYYSSRGEEMKRFSVRDGMGVERLRQLAGIETAIITGENSASVIQRAEKLGITELYLRIRDKKSCLIELGHKRGYELAEMAYIGDDINDLEAMRLAGLCGCPSDAMSEIQRIAHYKCTQRGGFGAFREFSEWIISSRF